MSALRSRRRVFLARLAAAPLALAFGGACATEAPVLMVLGDSISAGYGLGNGEGWVSLLADRMHREHYPQKVVNASISGDTTAGGRARLAPLLAQHKPGVVIVELGGNDALRGGDLSATRANLDAIVAAVQAAGGKPLLVGMQIPPNYGSAYVKAFSAIFGAVAAARHVPLVPFVFEGFGDDLTQFQADRVHPTAAAQPRILANVWPTLVPLLAHR